MRKILKLLMVLLIMLGIAISALSFISVDSMANIPLPSPDGQGTLRSDGECTGRPLNC